MLDIWLLVSNMSQVIKNGNRLRVHRFKGSRFTKIGVVESCVPFGKFNRVSAYK